MTDDDLTKQIIGCAYKVDNTHLANWGFRYWNALSRPCFLPQHENPFGRMRTVADASIVEPTLITTAFQRRAQQRPQSRPG
jgi:hypothetical protein